MISLLPRLTTLLKVKQMPNIHPVVKDVIANAKGQGWSDFRLCLEADVSKNMLYWWSVGRSPTLSKLQKILDVLGYELRLVKKGDE